MHPEKEPQIHGVSDESHWEITLVDTGLDTLKGGRIKRIEKYIITIFSTFIAGILNI